MVHRTLETEFIPTPCHMVLNTTVYIKIMTKIMSITLTQCLQSHIVNALIIRYFLELNIHFTVYFCSCMKGEVVLSSTIQSLQ